MAAGMVGKAVGVVAKASAGVAKALGPDTSTVAAPGTVAGES